MSFSSNTLGWVSRIYAHLTGWVMHFWAATFPNVPPPPYLLTDPSLFYFVSKISTIAFFQDVQMGQRVLMVSINIAAYARTDLLENSVKMVRKRYSYRILRYHSEETYTVTLSIHHHSV